jgi:hypothetical protein
MSLVQPPAERDLQGILVPEFALLSATVTASQEAGPRPGEAVPTQRTAMQMVPSGVLDVALDDIEIVTLRAGVVGSATQRWRYVGGTLRSCDPPTVASGFEFIDRALAANRYTRPHAIRRTTTGELVTVVIYDLTTVQVWRQSPDATSLGGWDSVDVEATGAATAAGLAEDPATGRIVCLYAYEVATTKTQIRMAYSDDGGATWQVGSEACLGDPLAVSSDKVTRIRTAFLNGVLAVVVWVQDAADVLYQYSSDTSGAALSLVETFSSSNKGCPDLKARDGVLYCATIEYDAGGSLSTLVPYVRRLTSAGQGLSTADAVLAGDSSLWEWAVRSGGLLTEAECALLVDDDGVLYLYGRDHFAGGGGFPASMYEIGVTLSQDGGATWSYMHISPSGSMAGVVVHKGDASTYLKDIAVAPERGRAVLLSRHAGTAGDSLSAVYLGGWTTVGKGQDASYPRDRGVAGWAETWLPLAKPQGTSFATETLTGAATSTLGSGGVTLAAAGTDVAYYSVAPDTSGVLADGVEVEHHVTVPSGTAIHDARISDGAGNSYSVRLSITTTTATLRDLVAGVNLGSVSIDATAGIALRIALEKASGAWGGAVGRVRAWVRQDGSSSGIVTYGPRADREWTQVASYSTLSAGSSSTTNLSWGILVAGSAVYRASFYSGGLYVAWGISGSAAGVARGRLLCGQATPYHVVRGLRMHGENGPTVIGDTWDHATAFEFPAEAIQANLHPSPRRVHRATGDGLDVDYTWTDFNLGWRSGDLLAIYVRGNWKNATLYRDLGAANQVAALDKSTGLKSLAFTRSRNTLIPSAGAGGNDAAFHFHEGALAGAWADFGGGIVRKIQWNRAGSWIGGASPAGYARAEIDLETYGGGDPASGSFDIIMPAALFITEAMASTNAFLLRVTGATTAEGYIETAKVVIGRFRLFGHEHGYGRALTVTPAYDLTETRGGGRRGRRRAPARPALEFAYDEGVDTTGLHTPGAPANHITLGYTGADALAAPADLPRTLQGLFTAMDGAVLPGVFAPAVPQQAAATTSSTPITLLNPEAALYGQFLTETLRLDNVLGHEMQDPGEVFRIPAIRWELLV